MELPAEFSVVDILLFTSSPAIRKSVALPVVRLPLETFGLATGVEPVEALPAASGVAPTWAISYNRQVVSPRRPDSRLAN